MGGTAGDSIVLSLSVMIKRTAFDYVHPVVETTSDKKVATSADSFQETNLERALSHRKSSLDKLFSKVSLTPLASGAPTSSATATRKVKAHMNLEIDEIAETDEAGADGDEGEKISSGDLNAVYSRAVKHDATLPEIDPPETFSLVLRPYQKQALKWMCDMEAGDDGGLTGGREKSMHPLWKE